MSASLFTALVCVFAIPIGFDRGAAYSRIDSEWYLLIAHGNTGEAMQPFTSRQLAPLLARALSAFTHLSVEHAFLMLGIVSIATLAWVVSYILFSARLPAAWLCAIGAIYFWPALFGSFMLPDTLSAALLAVFLLTLWKRSYLAAALMLLPMFVARESTIVVLLCLLIVGWKKVPGRILTLAFASSAAGMFIVRQLTLGAHTNREHLNPLLYMAGKVPWNFFANVLAMGPWMPSLTNFCAGPRWTVTLPFGLHIGGASVIGLCGYDPTWQLHSLLLALCSFGLLPAFAAYLLRYHRRALWPADTFARFCIVYGGLSFVIAPLLGHTTERLFLYGWPAFLLAVPLAAAHVWPSSIALRTTWILLAIHVATAWLDWFVYRSGDQQGFALAAILTACVLAANAFAWHLLRTFDRSAPAVQPA